MEGAVKELKVSVKDGKSCEKVLTIELAQDEIKKEFDEFFTSIAPKAKIPGFRPGKAPRNVLEMHYKNEAREDVLKHLISHSYRQAIQEKSLEPLSIPDIKNVEFTDSKLSYQALIEIRPKIKLSRVTGLNAKKVSAEVKPEEIEDHLKHLQDSLAQYKVLDNRPAAIGDYLIVDYIFESEGKEIEKRNDDWVELRKEDYLKGFSEQLVGAKANDEKVITVTLPEDFGRKELAGKPATFKVKVKEVKEKVTPPLSDELAKEAGDFQTLAELKTKVENDMRTTKERQVETDYERALLDELIKHNKIELPQGLVNRRKEYLLSETIENYKRRGLPMDKSEEMKKTLQPEIEKEATRQVHLAFLLDEIAMKENITVSEEAIKERFASVAQQIHQPVDVVEKYYADHEDALDSLRDQLRNEQVIEFIKKNAKTN